MNVLNKTAFSIATGLLLLAAQPTSSVADSIYKWVDDNGQVHFGQQPPDNRQSEEINAKTPRSFGQNIEREAQVDVQADAPVAVTTATDNVESTKNVVEGAATVQKDSKLCAKAQQSKQLIMSKPIIRRDGRLLSIEERNDELAYLEEVISIHC